ncbi:hypothetical protein QBC43DRAFT_306997 [Cladorrhinum sp. PSN259]|nr:hypothetical protein QBC43DRAFT_306997 [Cladorrhinum sp. PSN259]
MWLCLSGGWWFGHGESFLFSLFFFLVWEGEWKGDDSRGYGEIYVWPSQLISPRAEVSTLGRCYVGKYPQSGIVTRFFLSAGPRSGAV